MKILAIERELGEGSAGTGAALLRAEAERVWQLHLAGVIREAYFRAEDRCAVLVLEAASPEAAREALATLPLVREGLISFEVSALVPYDGFARLFEPLPEAAEQQAW